jgi:hypothetical protein
VRDTFDDLLFVECVSRVRVTIVDGRKTLSPTYIFPWTGSNAIV